MKTKSQNLQSGFTLVEALVAITILIVGVIGPLSLAAQGIGDGIFARNQVAANYLAQEALEIVINKRYALARKAQYLPPTSPATIFSNLEIQNCISATTAGNFCSVNATDATIQPDCPASDETNCRLVFNKQAFLYSLPPTPNSGVLTTGAVFTRLVQIRLVSSDEIAVTVTVKWNNKEVPKSLTLVEYLFTKG